MAYADFTLTTFGETWLAQCIDDAANGTTRAKVESMDFGNSAAGYVGTTRMTGSALWYSDATSVRVYSSGTSLGIRGTASNALANWDVFDGSFNAVQVIGSIDGTPGIVAYSLAADVEIIPEPDVQVVQRTMTVNFATGAATAVTCAAVQSGYALEGDVVKLAPADNVGAVKLSDGSGHSLQLECNAAGELKASGGARFGGDVRVAGEAVVETDIVAGGDLSINGNATITGPLRAHNTIRRVIVRRSGGTTTWYADGVAGSGSAIDIAAAINAAGGAGVYWSSDNPAPRYIAPVEVFDTDNFPTSASWTFVCDRWWY